MTFDQLGLRSVIGKWESYHSLDLTAATDRFPITLQGGLLEALVSTDFAEAWTRVMVELPFLHKGKYYYYNAGQPMGAYSS